MPKSQHHQFRLLDAIVEVVAHSTERQTPKARKICVGYLDADSGTLQEQAKYARKIFTKGVGCCRPIGQPPTLCPLNLRCRSTREVELGRHNLSKAIETREQLFHRDCFAAIRLGNGLKKLGLFFR